MVLSQVSSLNLSLVGPGMCPGMLTSSEPEPMEGFCSDTGEAFDAPHWQTDILSFASLALIGCFWLGLEGMFDLRVILNH